ncbi:MAG: hypothetical protein CO113_10010, partial [Elusimicrobia bacterium CG_4_9_14_3_um_filter_62_55]
QLAKSCSPSSALRNNTSPSCLSIAGGCGDFTQNGERLIDEVRVLNFALSPEEIALNAASAEGALAFGAALSTDGGITFQAVDPSSVSLTGIDATTSTETLAANGLALVESESLAAPLNVVRLSASDIAGRTTDFYFDIIADTTPPVLAVLFPEAGAVYSENSPAITPLVSVEDRLDPAPAVSAQWVQVTDEGGNGELDRIEISTGAPFDPSLFDAGTWELAVRAVDFAGNASTAASGLIRFGDVLPPVTILVVSGPVVFGDRVFATPRSSLTLTATDDLSGVAGSSFSVDSADLFLDYTGTITITDEGAHDFRFFSTDFAGNMEEVRLSSIAVDGTGPAVALEFHAPWRVLSGTETIFIAGLGPLAISTTDYPEAAVGGTTAYLSVDGAPSVEVPQALFFQEGMRALEFWAVDALGNQGDTQTSVVKFDVTPPAAVEMLSAQAVSSTSVRYFWTATGDDGSSGDIFDAAVRLEFGTDSDSLLATALMSSGTLIADAALEWTLEGLSPGTTYYAAVSARDTAGNWSAASNVAEIQTRFLSVSTDSVVTISAEQPIEVTVVSTETAALPFTVAVDSQAIAPATHDFYEFESGLIFPEEAPAVITFLFNPTLIDPLSLSIYTYDETNMIWSSASVFNQSITVVSAEQWIISGEIFHTSLYAPFVRDSKPPLTSLSVEGPAFEDWLSTASRIRLTAVDQAPLGGTASGVLET